MSATLHIYSPEEEPQSLAVPKLDAVFLVVQRQNGHWSSGAKIVSTHDHETDAESHAWKLKRDHPQQCFGVFKLRSEAREVKNPIEIVRVEGNA